MARYTDHSEDSALAADRARDAGDEAFLIELLANGDRLGRVAAARYLGELRAEEAREPLQSRLFAGDELLRLAAARSLGQIGDNRSADSLRDVGLSDESFDVRAVSAEALRHIGDPRATVVLMGLLRDPAVPHRLRRWAIQGLISMKAFDSFALIESSVSSLSPVSLWRWVLRWRLRRLMRSSRASNVDRI